ncbi:DAK2 domain-containing protein [soil metagenome]
MAVSAPAVQLDLLAARRWALTARAMLAEARPRIDALNVFPVPDGDTGTNMFLTVDGALDMLRERPDLTGRPLQLHEGLGLIARGMLLSARGNSGVILSQLARGLHEAVADAGPERQSVRPDVLADAFVRADAMAWAGVTSPVEGTILSVSRAAAAGATRAAALRDAEVHAVALAALQDARAALVRTPQQLPVLATAGVVDAGGAGLVLLVEALERVLSGRGAEGPDPTRASWFGGVPATAVDDVAAAVEGSPLRTLPRVPCEEHGDGAHEVMYLLTGSDPARADHLRAHLARVGSSVLVVGGPGEWRVHVHLDQPQAALEAGAAAGRVEQVTITALPTAGRVPPAEITERPAVGVVTCAAGDGLAAVFRRAGAQVVRSAPGARASTGQLLNGIGAVEARGVILLPNDPDTLMAAQAAADAAGRDGLVVEVIDSVAAVQGVAALAVLHHDDDLAANVAAMQEAVDATRHGALTTAGRDGPTPVGPCRAGQWLGLVAGRIVTVDDAPASVLHGVLAALVDEDTERLTVVLGEGARRGAVQQVLDEMLPQRHTELGVDWIEGGQPTYPWLFGAE